MFADYVICCYRAWTRMPYTVDPLAMLIVREK